MKAAKTSATDRSITVKATATPKEVEAAFEAAYASFAARMGLTMEDGPTVAEAAEGKLGIRQLDPIVVADVPKYLAPFAIDKLGLVPAYPPEVVSDGPAQKGQSFSFELEVPLKSTSGLDSYDPVEISLPSFAISEEAVEAQLAEMAEFYAEFVECAPRPAQLGDGCLVNVRATVNGEEVSDLKSENAIYLLGSCTYGEAFDEKLAGMQAGETAEFRFEHVVDGVPETVNCTVDLLEVRERVVPKIDDAWIARNAPGAGTLDNFKDLIRQEFLEQYEDDYEDMKRQEAAAELAKRYTEPIPDAAIEAMAETLVNGLRARLAIQGETLEAYIEKNGGEQQFNLDTMMQARDSVKQGYALDALYAHEGLSIDDDDILAACATLDDGDPQAVRVQMEKSGCGYMLRETAERQKAARWLADNACVVTTASMSHPSRQKRS